MIITRSPLRITLGGGGTDLPSYYNDNAGFLVSAAIDKYIYITLHKTFVEELIIKYSQMERVKTVDEVKHPIIREAMKLAKVDAPFLEIASMAAIPAGTGLGSSGSFTTALLKGFHVLKNNIVHPRELAEQACHIEIDLLEEPVGKQDQYIAAYGGITCFRFLPDNKVDAWPINMEQDVLYELEDNLLLFFTGYSRVSHDILKEQKEKTKIRDKDMINNLHYVKELGLESRSALESGDLQKFAELLNVQWEYKQKRSKKMCNDPIVDWYKLGLKNGALGGKLIGAGGGGFLMFYAEDRKRLRLAMKDAGLEEVRFKFDFAGTSVVINS